MRLEPEGDRHVQQARDLRRRGLLWFTGWISSRLGLGFHVDGFGAAFLGGIVVGLVAWALSMFLGEPKKHTDDRR